MTERRRLPSVDALLNTGRGQELISHYGWELTLAALRNALATAREGFTSKDIKELPDENALLDQAGDCLEDWLAPTLRVVINATGVILHTNLGRAPLSQAAQKAIEHAAQNYSTLEYNLATGVRGSRMVHAEELLRRLTGAQAALVVNNNAAAVLLCLSALARRRAVVISRTQLIEIGGGFRIPEVMAQSGAKLLEVGTTNRVALDDYEAVMNQNPAAILHAHHSNFKILGFTREPDLPDLAGLAQRYNIPLLDDQGSGALLDSSRFGLGHETTVQESLAAGSDLVCFSGDKLLGGPQAGIILGKKELIARLIKHPLARAIRSDKLCLAGLSATLLHYLKGEAESCIPVWQMISADPQEIKVRASAWRSALDAGEVITGRSTIGGGSLPEETLPTSLLALSVGNPNRFMAELRQQDPPIIARIQGDRVILDPRTVINTQEDSLLSSLQKLLG